MFARATIVAAVHDASTRLIALRSEPPLVVRATPHAVYLVGGAAGPLGGDTLEVGVHVHEGAQLVVRSAAATLAQPARDGGRSRARLRVNVERAARLSLRPEPLISVRGSDHTIDNHIELAEDARCELLEELVLGRHGEEGGRVRSRLQVTRGGRTICLHETDYGGDAAHWRSGAVLGRARAVHSRLVIAPDAPNEARAATDEHGDPSAAWLPFAPGAALLVAVGRTLGHARRAADQLRLTPATRGLSSSEGWS